MLTARWGQTPEDLRRLATGAPHPRTRERFLALYAEVFIWRGRFSADFRRFWPESFLGVAM
jgi:hypothetical protein